jgi:hypothetical protein
MRASTIFAAALAATAASAAGPLYPRTNETSTTYFPTGTGTGVLPPPTGGATVTLTSVVPPTPTGGDETPTSPPGSGGAAGLAAPVWVGALAAVAIGAFQM